MSSMMDKLQNIEKKFIALEDRIGHDTLSSEELTDLTKQHARLSPVVEKFREYRLVEDDLTLAQEMIADSDRETQALGHHDAAIAEKRLKELHQELLVLLLPRDPYDDKNVILEVRAGTGGDEAALFVGDLVRMYQKYAEKRLWKVEPMSFTPSAAGGFKEAIYLISGDRVYSSLKHEVGVHRVQRVPATESQGRLHTSACTVAVLPQPDDVEIHINPADLEIKTCRSSGAGGQHLNKTDSAIRIVHIPTGIAVECQDERSQHKNKDKAMKVLKSRLYDLEKSKADAAAREDRRAQVGSGDRSERIRTYNFPQGRITDHRLSLSLYKLPEILEGNLSEIVDRLVAHHTALLMQAQNSEIKATTSI